MNYSLASDNSLLASEQIDPKPLESLRFRLLWVALTISVLGDQFYFVALPWLVLHLTGDSFAVGTVLALAGVPRSLLMLVGGAMTDRFSPRNVMLIVNCCRMVLMGALAYLVLIQKIQIWMVYLFVLGFGVADAFFFPAQNSIVPKIVAKKYLQTGNALIQSTVQLSMFIGPMTAGWVIAMLGTSFKKMLVKVTILAATPTEVMGIGLAFIINMCGFLLSAVILVLISMPEVETAEEPNHDNLLVSMREGLAYVWHDPLLVRIFLIIAALNFFWTGPVLVGIPILANVRFPEGAVAFGIIMSAEGAGNFLGIILSGLLPRPKPERFGLMVILIPLSLFSGVALYAFVTSSIWGALVMLIMAVGNGYLTIMLITWLQNRTPEKTLGRLMSLFVFSSVGILPLTQTLSGLIIKYSLTGLFIGGGISVLAVTIIAALMPQIWAMGLEENTNSEISKTSEAETVS